MSNYDTPELLCHALSVFIKETLEQAAALRAYSYVFCNKNCENVFYKEHMILYGANLFLS